MKKRAKYIFSKGSLKRKENTIFFENEEIKTIIPIETIREIYFMNEISINTKLLSYLSEKMINVHLFNHYGNYVGSFYSKNSCKNFYLRKKQMEAYQEKRLKIAREVVKGIAEGMVYCMNHYYKHGDEDAKIFIKEITELKENKIKKTISVNQLMMLEGRMWESFYRNISKQIEGKMVFEKRVKRKPDNEINAMISFANSILYSKVSSQLRRTQIDLGISFLHEITDRRESLILDIADIFKPIIVYPSILKLVNRKEIKTEKHFEKQLEYCILNDEGKKILIKEIEERLEKTIDHQKLKRKVTISTCIKLEAYKMIKEFLGEKDYKVFSMKEGF